MVIWDFLTSHADLQKKDMEKLSVETLYSEIRSRRMTADAQFDFLQTCIGLGADSVAVSNMIYDCLGVSGEDLIEALCKRI